MLNSLLMMEIMKHELQTFKNSTIPSYKKQMIQQIENNHLKTLNKREYKSLLIMEQWKSYTHLNIVTIKSS